ncbi:MAG TPA: hypothetical protein VF735_04455 [Pyrinomonadaceae bacterium]|jgi:Trk K+ transport system NAD-binding subunit
MLSRLIVLGGRREEFFVSGGATVLEAGEGLPVLADQRSLAAVRELAGAIHQTTA